jgi:hypothetical protein
MVAADDRERLESEHALDHAVGLRPIADEIAEDERAIPGLAGGGREHGVERVHVRVNVRQDQETHSMIRSATSSGRAAASTRTRAVR